MYIQYRDSIINTDHVIKFDVEDFEGSSPENKIIVVTLMYTNSDYAKTVDLFVGDITVSSKHGLEVAKRKVLLYLSDILSKTNKIVTFDPDLALKGNRPFETADDVKDLYVVKSVR